MIEAASARRMGRTALGLVMLGMAACGGDAELAVSNPRTTPTPVGACDGGVGLQVRGAVEMPNGRVAHGATLGERFAALVAAPAEALDGGVRRVGSGVEVQLVRLRRENPNAANPEVLATARTNGRGEFCLGLPDGTDPSICRYVVQVGNRDDRSLTRAFVVGTDEPTDIDYRSEAVVRLVLGQRPPTGLCEFDPDELRDVYQAVLDTPGSVTGSDAEEVNAVATSIAAADPVVRQALAAGADLPPTPTPTHTAPPATASATAPAGIPTRTPTRTRTPGIRVTRTPQGGFQTPTRAAPTRTRTATPVGAAATLPPAARRGRLAAARA